MNYKRTNKQKGFTLLEIIIVLIIIGVLASLALPSFLGLVQKSYSGEADQSASAIRGAVLRCNTTKSDYTQCPFTNIDIADPTNAAGSHFGYVIGGDSNTLIVTATRNVTDGGSNTNTILLTQDDGVTPATITRSGTTIWAGID